MKHQALFSSKDKSKKNKSVICCNFASGFKGYHIYRKNSISIFRQEAFFKKKLENCVCKTQVMPPCPKPVLIPCSILTLTLNTFNQYWRLMSEMSKSKLQQFCQKLYFCEQKNTCISSNAFNSCAKFQNECLKTLRGIDYTILLPLTET